MAISWHAKQILGASFFCSRDDATCSNPKLIFPSVAYQLGQFNSRFRDEVSQVVKSNPEIGYSSLSNQLERLIVNPLKILGESFPSCMVVIDALDECKDIGTTSEVLAVLALYVKKLLQIHFLLTSRPEKKITSHFKSSTLETETREFILHEVWLGVVRNDIEKYITAKLAETTKNIISRNRGRQRSIFKLCPVFLLAFLSSLRHASNSLKITTPTIQEGN